MVEIIGLQLCWQQAMEEGSRLITCPYRQICRISTHPVATRGARSNANPSCCHLDQERLHRMDEFIDAMLEDNPDLTTRELNRMLRRQFGTHISKGRIAYGDDFIDLKEYQLQTLKANDLKAWMNAHPKLEHQSEQSHGHNRHIAADKQQPSESTHLRKPKLSKDGSRDQNREWEVGHNTRYNDIDDENQLKR